ncbi:uncharacterized protein EHS24_006295 [Apiotrichum porosum]|uniref:Uncharacterized protein n=1 Tax=Apiotrichum porosum TaxID=105984 RepID=A0A427Y158_9TREE|nr:uncharacterized protein EHS24_006295 [Apiotrichum porosum]RSH84770.1 hypothetical protein EHS24_006295 [Apiotrichum porosum]
MPPITLLPAVPLEFPLPLDRFGQFYAYIDAVGDDDVLTENMLQSAMNLLTTLASGNVTPDVMSTAGMLVVREKVDLAQILGGTSGQTTSFTQQRIPALLIKWKNEVDALRKAQVPSQSQTSKTVASHQSGVRNPDIVVIFKPP